MRLRVHKYTRVHIEEVYNVRADLLGRWSSLSVFHRSINNSIPSSSSSKNLIWPSSVELQEEHEKLAEFFSQNLLFVDELWKNFIHDVLVQNESADIQLRLGIIAHFNANGHRGTKTTEQVICKQYICNIVAIDTGSIVCSYLQYPSTTGGEQILHIFGPAFHRTVSDLPNFDYVYIASNTSGKKHFLMLRNDHLDYKFSFACHNLTAETTAKAIIEWSATFGVLKLLTSDSPMYEVKEISFSFQYSYQCKLNRKIVHAKVLYQCFWRSFCKDGPTRPVNTSKQCIIDRLLMYRPPYLYLCYKTRCSLT